MSEDARVRAVRWGIVPAVLAALEIIPRLGLVNPISLVPLSEMVWQLWLLISDGILGAAHRCARSTSIVAAGALAVVTGLPLGMLLWRLERVRRVLQPYLTTYYAIPIFAFYPLFIAIFGLSAWPVIIIAWAWAVVAVVLNTVIGLNEVPEVLVKVGRSLRLSPWRMFTRVYFPAATPYIFTGFKLAASYTVIGVIASEFIQAETGVGWFVGFSYNNFAIKNMYAAILLILAFAIAVNSLLLRLERRLYGQAGLTMPTTAPPPAAAARAPTASCSASSPSRCCCSPSGRWSACSPATSTSPRPPRPSTRSPTASRAAGSSRASARRSPRPRSGFAIAAVAGLWIGVDARARRASGARSSSRSRCRVYSIPKVTLFPIFLTVFGFGLYSKIAFGMFHGIFPILIITMNATREVQPGPPQGGALAAAVAPARRSAR